MTPTPNDSPDRAAPAAPDPAAERGADHTADRAPDPAPGPAPDRAPALLRCVPAPTTVALCWSLLVLAGHAWAGLAPVSSQLATAGQIVLFTLLLHALHEGGHVITGLLVEVPFSRVTLGPFVVTREEAPDGWRARWGWNRAWQKVAGCVERDLTPAPGMRAGLTATALGGPVASILGGIALSGGPGLLHGLGVVSILIGLGNAVPVTFMGQASDGMLVWRLWSRHPEHVAWRAQFCEGEAEGETAAAA